MGNRFVVNFSLSGEDCSYIQGPLRLVWTLTCKNWKYVSFLIFHYVFLLLNYMQKVLIIIPNCYIIFWYPYNPNKNLIFKLAANTTHVLLI
jgi:hypothetical protein